MLLRVPFCRIFFLTEQDYQPCVHPPTWRDQVSVSIPPSARVAKLYPRAQSSLFVAAYGSQGCGGGIRTHSPQRTLVIPFVNNTHRSILMETYDLTVCVLITASRYYFRFSNDYSHVFQCHRSTRSCAPSFQESLLCLVLKQRKRVGVGQITLSLAFPTRTERRLCRVYLTSGGVE